MVVGNVAGNGDASAAYGLMEAKICRDGVVIALPPLPNKPDKKPTIAPVINTTHLLPVISLFYL